MILPCAGPVFEELHAFLRVYVRFFRGETALQLLEVVIHHGEIKPLGGWQAVAFATRMLGGRVGHSTLINSVNLFSTGHHKERTQVLIDKEDVCLCSKVIIRCYGALKGVRGIWTTYCSAVFWYCISSAFEV